MSTSFWIRECLAAVVFGIISVAIIVPARAAADKCDGSADYAGWTECVRREAISSDAKLNLAYQKVMNKLRDDADAVNHVRDAQRRWIAFRDAQCDLEGLPSAGSSAHSTIVAACVDRITAQRVDDLLSMLVCQDGDLSCLKPVNADSPSKTGPSIMVQRPTSRISSGVAFESLDVIEKMRVSGIWFPEQWIAFGGLSGPAIFEFSNIETGETFRAAVNGMALLDEDFWEKQGVSGPESLDVSTLVDKLKQ